MAQRPLDLEKVQRIYQLFESGAMISEIVAHISANREFVLKYLLAKYTKEQKRAIVNKNRKWTRGADNPNWKGGREITKNGFVVIWKSRSEKILEHRLIMQQYLGRKLAHNEIIRHINGKNGDNRLENLELISAGDVIHQIGEGHRP